MTTTPSPQDIPRAEARKNQVLEAATACFRKNGFHGTSMAQISKTAGMSVGHIYHYFENKEAIIASIVEADFMNLLIVIERIRQKSTDGDVLKAMVNDAEQGMNDVASDKNAPLMLEIVAEAARNPNVAAIIQKADAAAMTVLRQLFHDGLKFRGRECSDDALDGPIGLLAALFEGLTIRLIRNPNLDVKSYLPALSGFMAFIVENQIVPASKKLE